MVRGGRVRIGGVPTRKAAAAVGAEDVLTVNFGGGHVRVVRILAPGTRRGPAEEARRLYEEIDAPSGMPGPGLRADPSGHS